MGLLGSPVRRSEDRALLVGSGTYVGDVAPEGALHAVFVRSVIPHGEIQTVDAAEASSLPGVAAVFTASDLGIKPVAPALPGLDTAMTRTALATDRVRFVGEPVAIVLAESIALAADAAELVVVDVEPLPAVVGLDTARTDEILLHPAAGTNRCFTLGGEPDNDLFSDCEIVVSLEFDNPRLSGAPLEPRCAVSSWSESDAGLRLTQWSCTQFPHRAQEALAVGCGVTAEEVRVITPEVGGGFGAKNGAYPEDIVVALAARKIGQPVRWTETRSESMLNLAHGRGLRLTATLGGDRDGKLSTYKLHMDQDGGAYPGIGAVLPMFGHMMVTGSYTIEKVEFTAASYVTNTVPMGAYRGAGRPEATHGIERIVDRYAMEIGMDPAELRRRNFISPQAFPYTTLSGQVYDSGAYEDALDAVLGVLDIEPLRQEQSRRRTGDGREPFLGIGYAAYVEITNPLRNSEFGRVAIRPDGSALVLTGSSAHGQGHHTTFAQLAADALGIPFDQIEVRHGDTDEVPRGGGTGGSKSVQVGGSAVNRASEAVVDEGRRIAADLLEANLEDVIGDKDAGGFVVVGSPSVRVGWATVAAEVEKRGGELAAEVDFQPSGATFPFGVHASVVEVDRDTGGVTILRHVACDDAGVIVNPTIVDGQVHGGVAGGIAQALMEEFQYADDGTPMTTNFMDYGFISAAELPSFERVEHVTPTDLNPLGVKGIGEAGTIGATPAVQNAVVDAIAHLGIEHIDIPVTSERVWRVMNGATC
ncbi:MAG: xanthine dehydrogenase family protein molybdopterin-binding subunit [Acidimicrobiales bacterium]|nr:xanthine dehydrogenase family protein molybdopterin-binding subunit [Acidimicrobiales bacterium]